MALADAIDAAQWLRANTARKRGGLSPSSLTNLALSGKIRTLALPGTAVRFHAADCDAVRRELAAVPGVPAAAGA
jgi:hypothetical protein